VRVQEKYQVLYVYILWGGSASKVFGHALEQRDPIPGRYMNFSFLLRLHNVSGVQSRLVLGHFSHA
jgi:hypothetical protein